MNPMAVDELLTELGYDDSPNFLRADRARDFSQTIDYGQILRRAAEHCQLKGVYALHHSRKEAHETVVPLVYVCEAKNDDDSERIHRLVWNQNIAPFLIVVSQKAIRLYSGFRYERAGDAAKTSKQGLLREAGDHRTGDDVPRIVPLGQNRRRLRLGRVGKGNHPRNSGRLEPAREAKRPRCLAPRQGAYERGLPLSDWQIRLSLLFATQGHPVRPKAHEMGLGA